VTHSEIHAPRWSVGRVLPQIVLGIGGALAYHLARGSFMALLVFCVHAMLWWTFFANLKLADELHRVMAQHGEKLVSPDADGRPMGAGYPWYWLLPGILYGAGAFWDPLVEWCKLVLIVDLARLGLHLLAVSHSRAGMKHRLLLVEDEDYRNRFGIDYEKMGLGPTPDPSAPATQDGEEPSTTSSVDRR
jgi:hypothetical protein